MLQNYLKITLRSLLKQKGLAFINIFGLSLGLACFTLFLLYAVNELSFDRFHQKADRIFRIYQHEVAMGGNPAAKHSFMPMLMGPALEEDFPDIESALRLKDPWDAEYIRANGQVSRTGVTYADPAFFEVFSFPLVSGDPVSALKDRHSVVLTEKTAHQYFGNENPVGKTVEIKVEEDFEPFTVTAVAKNPPANSTLQFDVLCNFQRFTETQMAKEFGHEWGNMSFQVFVLLRPGSSLAADPSPLAAFRKKYYPNEEENYRSSGRWTGEGPPVRYALQALQDLHTQPGIDGSFTPAIDPKNIWILMAIAAGLLVIACINFTTLAIGRSAGRAKEVGVRKVVGGGRSQLAGQFLTEALAMSFGAALLGLGLAQVLLPFFNRLSEKDLSFSFSQYPELWGLLAGLTLLTGILAGSYPALVLSGFQPIETLKNKVRLSGSNFFTRSLVTLQFVLSAGLIISTLVMLRQLDFMKKRNPGFQKENVVIVDATSVDGCKVFPLFKQAVEHNPMIAGIARSSHGLGEGMGYARTNWDYQGEQKETYQYSVDSKYIEVLGMQIEAGRNFDAAISTDTTSAVIVNEAFVQSFGWTKETALGQPIHGFERQGITPVVIGVVKNFNFRSFHEAVKPQLFQQFQEWGVSRYFVRLKPGDPSAALASLEAAWKSAVPDIPFSYSFLDESLGRFYKSEARWGHIVGWAGGISIFLACLGLLGLSSLAAVNRMKEIGIRKVLGASVTSVVGLLSRDFLSLVIVSLVIASPLAYFFMNKWLEDFAYRIELQWWVFATAGVAALGTAFLTVSFQSVRAALADPVKSLRSE